MGKLVMVGVSHHAAPLALRERVAIDQAAWRAAAPNTPATILLSTCNRVEVYAWVEARPAEAARLLRRRLANAAGLDAASLQPYLVTQIGRDALIHLVRVAAGLDSLVTGEDQIRGQMRQALRAAEGSGPLPAALRGTFQRLGEAASRVRAVTTLRSAPSIASAGVSVAVRAVPDPIAGQLAVVLGAGMTARAVAEALLRHGARVRLLNRTPAHAAQITGYLGSKVETDGLDGLTTALAEARLIVGATASRQPVIDRSAVEMALPARGGRPLVLLDLAVPRDVDAGVRDLAGITLIDLDDLERLCPINSGACRADLLRAEALSVQEADRLAEWLRSRAVSPAIVELREYAEKIRSREMQRSASRLRELTPEQIAAVETLTTSIVSKLMHGPTVALRAAAIRPGGVGRSRSQIMRLLQPTLARTA